MSKYAILGCLCVLALGALGAQAEMRIHTTDGQILTVPVERNKVKWIEFGNSMGQMPARFQSYRVFHAVPNQNSNAFKANRENNLAVDTRTWDRIPYYMAPSFRKELYVGQNQRCYLSGNESGSAGWSVDNFIFIEIHSQRGTQRFVVGTVDPVSYKGRRVTQLGRKSFNFGATEIDLTQYIPKGTPVTISISALDYGGAGKVSNLFLIVK